MNTMRHQLTPVRGRISIGALVCLLALSTRGIEPTSQPRPQHGLDMDYGSFLSYSVLKPGAPMKTSGAKKGQIPAPLPWQPNELIARRGITVKLGADTAICFDSDTMRYAAGWQGGWLDISKTHLANEKGSLPAIAVGKIAFTTADGPGYAKRDSLDDPRPDQQGPLPKDWAHFDGIYRTGPVPIFAYHVGSVAILDCPGLEGTANQIAFTRYLHISASKQSVKLVICDLPGETAEASGRNVSVKISGETSTMCVGVRNAPEGTHLKATGTRVELTVPPLTEPKQFQIVIAQWPADAMKDFDQIIRSGNDGRSDLEQQTHGGERRWPDVLTTPAAIGAENGAYTVDTIALPEKNPWNSWMRLTALDFFEDGRAAVCTWSGDVWIVSGLQGKLDQVTWKRFAAGLYDPLGLKIVDDHIYVLARDGIVKLHDLYGRC